MLGRAAGATRYEHSCAKDASSWQPIDERVPVPLTFWFKVAWGIGHLATATTITIVSTQVLAYFTDHAALVPDVAGSILFTAKLYDVASDFGVGLLSDRTAGPWGRRRPWMASGAVLLALSSSLYSESISRLPRRAS